MLRMTTSPLAADLSGCRDTQWLDLLAGCQGLPEQIAALCRASIVCVLGEPHPAGCPGPDRPEVHRLGVRRAPPRGAQRTAPGAGCGAHARGIRRPRRCRCGEEFRGLGRRIAAALGRRHSAGWPCRLTCVETWRSSGEAVGETSRTIARHSPGAAAPTARRRAVPGMSTGLDVPHGRDRARQTAAAVVAAAACEQGQESVFHLLPIVLVATFTLTAALPDGTPGSASPSSAWPGWAVPPSSR